MRTLQLTHEQIATLQRALAIAELKFNELRTQYIEQMVYAKGGETHIEETTKEADAMFTKENEYTALLLILNNSELETN